MILQTLTTTPPNELTGSLFWCKAAKAHVYARVRRRETLVDYLTLKLRLKGQHPSPQKKRSRGDANHFLSIQLFVCVTMTGGWFWGLGEAAIRPRWSCPPPSPTHRHTMAWDLITQAVFCPLTPLPLFQPRHDHEFSRQRETELGPWSRCRGWSCHHTLSARTD